MRGDVLAEGTGIPAPAVRQHKALDQRGLRSAGGNWGARYGSGASLRRSELRLPWTIHTTVHPLLCCSMASKATLACALLFQAYWHNTCHLDQLYKRVHDSSVTWTASAAPCPRHCGTCDTILYCAQTHTCIEFSFCFPCFEGSVCCVPHTFLAHMKTASRARRIVDVTIGSCGKE